MRYKCRRKPDDHFSLLEPQSLKPEADAKTALKIMSSPGANRIRQASCVDRVIPKSSSETLQLQSGAQAFARVIAKRRATRRSLSQLSEQKISSACYPLRVDLP